jgi:phosphonate degradation associated HDIG domain protein
MALQIEQITAVFQTQGAVQYGAEAITQQQHALQCAHLAEQAGASPALVAAALLHDLGHLLAPKISTPSLAADDVHQYVAIPFLRGIFPNAVIEPIRLHVDAKRYLCQVDPGYWARLSPASRRSLELQGGPFSKEAAASFMGQAFANDAVALRRWDDLAKDPTASPPDWAHYVTILTRAAN